MKKIKNDMGYLLGEDINGTKHYLQIASWDCEWYWGFGYIISKYSWLHFDTLFLNNGGYVEEFKKFFIKTPLTDNEIWELLGYMKEFYVLKEYAELLKHGNYITSSAKHVLDTQFEHDNLKEYERINKVILPTLFEKIYKMLEE